MEMGGMGRRTCNYKLQLRVTYRFLFTSPTSCKVSPSLTAWLHWPLTGCHLFRSSAFQPEPQARHFHVSQNSTASQESNVALRRTSLLFSATDAKKFEEASKIGNLVPRYKCLFSDQLTPVLAYRCLVKEDDREAPSFLFESVEQSTQGRYNVVGAQPAMEIVAKENKVTALDHEGGCSSDQFVEQDPIAVPK
uniref:anthranilate synthase alpha subunit 1, chloroplastic-like isoform X2 n=1 Tax=Fragaria vesca subsp. vesca TaxID=101020 RepID=UPI0005C7FDE4|nr:PREDICTED: anthranilate synthase alpha subunit 1, chloroplastic-like isoform X2 [Fragaria vesca subsp. vesca]